MSSAYSNKDFEMTMTCNECGATDIQKGGFGECVAQAKANGWIIRKIDGDWVHYCCEKCFQGLPNA